MLRIKDSLSKLNSLKDSLSRTRTQGLGLKDSLSRTRTQGLSLKDSISRTRTQGLSLKDSLSRTTQGLSLKDYPRTLSGKESQGFNMARMIPIQRKTKIIMGKSTMYTPCTTRTTTLAELLADLVERGYKEALYIHEAVLNTGEKVESLDFFNTKSVVTLCSPLERQNELVMDLLKVSQGE